MNSRSPLHPAVAFCISLAGASLACSGGTPPGPPATQGGDGDAPGGTSGGLPGSPGGTAGTDVWNLRVDVPGFRDPVLASVAKGGNAADVRILALPTVYVGAVLHATPLPIGFDGAFSDTFCNTVRTRAEAAKAGGAGSAAARMLVRGGVGVAVEVRATPLLGPAFEQRMIAAARAAGATQASLQVTDGLVLSNATIALDLAADATTRILGEGELVSGLESGFEASYGSLLASGAFGVEIAAKDLLCDLAAGKATLRLTVTGSHGALPYTSPAALTGLEAKAP